MPDHYDATVIAHELEVCRRRGLDWLDRDTSNQAPVRVDDLQQLAEDYIEAKGLVTVGRIDQIKLLLRAGINGFKDQGHSTDADLLRHIFFGASMDGAIKSPTELLKDVQAMFADTEARSRERRAAARRSFAQFLVRWVRSIGMEPTDPGEELQGRPTEAIRTGFADNEHFLDMLAAATRVTIVGITNEGLLPVLQEALQRKRAVVSPDAFWDSLRIVFLYRDLLPAINDEREVINDRDAALLQRRQEAFWAHKSIGAYLKRTHPTRWELHKTSYMPTLTGTLFEFANHRKIVHQLVRRARRPASESLYIELEDREERFSPVFEDIIRHSRSPDSVPVGVPVDTTFVTRMLRAHSTVLRDASGADGWLPMVLVVMTSRHGGRVEPVVQLRTAENSARELDMLSHLGGHVLEEDWADPDDRRARRDWSFRFDSEIPALAARRLLADVTAIEPAEGLRQHRTVGRYLYSDKEHLLFFVFSIDLPEGTQLPRRAEMRPVPLPDLLNVRKNHVLRSAAALCLMQVSDRVWREAAEVMALNLILHDHSDLGDALSSLAGRPPDERLLLAELITGFVEQTGPNWASAESDTQPLGLAGWQHREFFAALLPLYVELGVHGAADLMNAINADHGKASAISRLREIYQDEHRLDRAPMEL